MKSFTLVTLTLAAALSGGIVLERRPVQAEGADDGPTLSPQSRNLLSPGAAQLPDPTPASDETDAQRQPQRPCGQLGRQRSAASAGMAGGEVETSVPFGGGPRLR